MRHFYLWMIAAILFICGTNVLTSCKDDDSLDSKPKAGPLAEKLGGTWYSIYEATGTAKSENVGGEDVAYPRAGYIIWGIISYQPFRGA